MPNVAPTRPANFDWSGVIPHEYSTQIIEEAVLASAALQLGNIIPMGTSISEMPVPKTLPRAAFVTAPGGRKPYTDLMLENLTLKAEEVAAVTAIPDVFLEDSQINLWNWVRPRLAEAIGRALDAAVFFGTGAPGSFPNPGANGGLSHVNYSGVLITAGTDAVDAVNTAMGSVEERGLPVDGHAADLITKARFRGVRDQTGALLLGTEQVGTIQRPTLYGVPISYQQFTSAGTGIADFFTGAWQNLLIGVRSDIRYSMDPSAVIADQDGQVIISGWQDNVTPLKVWARFACQIIRPVTLRVPTGAPPFQKARLAGILGGSSGVLANHPHGPVAPPLENEAEAEPAKGKK
jgi:HK97 family phage major capsid protein